jgi:hypothetical protein
MTAGDLFGISIDGDDIEAALLAFLRRWMPTYLPAIVREKDPEGKLWPGGVGDPAKLGKPAVLPIREFTVKHAAEEKWPEDQLPMLLAYSPGFAAPPVRHGNGQVDASFLINVTAIASGVDIDDTKKLARVYASAANLAIVQKPDLEGIATATDWVDMKNFPVTRGVEAERNLMAVANVYVITIEGILNHQAGPPDPLEEPDVSPGPLPKVKEGGGSADVRPGKAAVERLREGGHFDPE